MMDPRPKDPTDRGLPNDDANQAGPLEKETPAPDLSERAWGGDQDIDTAGMIPGNKATEDDEPGGM
jgi:hypothetical protein